LDEKLVKGPILNLRNLHKQKLKTKKWENNLKSHIYIEIYDTFTVVVIIIIILKNEIKWLGWISVNLPMEAKKPTNMYCFKNGERSSGSAWQT
jgi:hypothetical protein